MADEHKPRRLARQSRAAPRQKNPLHIFEISPAEFLF